MTTIESRSPHFSEGDIVFHMYGWRESVVAPRHHAEISEGTGEELEFEFVAKDAGAFMVHCGTPPVLMHIMQGMYLPIIVDPQGGWGTDADKEFVIVQSEFYAKPGATADQPHTLDLERGAAEQPTHVVFNGAVGAMTGDKAPEVKVGESVRLFVEHDAFQCGYCTPGQIMSAAALIQEGRARTRDEIREYMSGNLCRCGAYPNIVAAIQQAMDAS